jgi:hypothetical protein
MPLRADVTLCSPDGASSIFQIIPLLSFPAVMNLVDLEAMVGFQQEQLPSEYLLCWVKLNIVDSLINRNLLLHVSIVY